MRRGTGLLMLKVIFISKGFFTFVRSENRAKSSRLLSTNNPLFINLNVTCVIQVMLVCINA